jgi:hypothetical protein
VVVVAEDGSFPASIDNMTAISDIATPRTTSFELPTAPDRSADE